MVKTSIEERQSNIDLVLRTLYPELEYVIHELRAPHKLGYYNSDIYFKITITNLIITNPTSRIDEYTVKGHDNICGGLFEFRLKIIRDMNKFLNEAIALGC